jgi:cystathionine beta-lyase
MRLNTKCVHEGTARDKEVFGINTPVHQSTAFLFPNEKNLIRYPRYSNTPTQEAPAKKICALEGAEDGMIFSSGMGAISITLLTYLNSGDHAVLQAGLYGGTQRFIANQFERLGIQTTMVDSIDFNDFITEIKDNTKLIYFESPTNPLLKVLELRGLASAAREKNVLTVIDNTFATPINQRPLEHGVDIVVHSGTKYLNGHSDLLCGAVATSKALMEKIRIAAVDMGPSLDMHAAYMLDRGLKTLGLRVTTQNENALASKRYSTLGSKVIQGMRSPKARWTDSAV